MYAVHSIQITKWKKQALDILTLGFGTGQKQRQKDDLEMVQELYRQIGRMKVEIDFLKKRWAHLANENKLSPKDIELHINKTDCVVPLRRHAELLWIGRSSLYYLPKEVDFSTLSIIMHRIDELYTKRPFYGSRKIAKDLCYSGIG